jgi:sulfur carrier protein
MTSNSMQQIQFNGEPLMVSSGKTISILLEEQQVCGRFIVVINDELVPKSDWDWYPVMPGDQVEIMSPISGG